MISGIFCEYRYFVYLDLLSFFNKNVIISISSVIGY